MDVFYRQELQPFDKSGLIESRENSVDCTPSGKAFKNDIATIFETDAARWIKHPQAIDLMRVKL